MIKKGFSESVAKEWSRTGVVAEDLYWIWYRDPVLFPSGASGTYDRLLWKSSLKGPAGVAVLPILPNGKIVLNLNYRHATRSWELELPRGALNRGESGEAAARRELAEETGLQTKSLTFLGELAPDSGALSSIVPVYAGWVGEEGESNRDESEAIDSIHAFSLRELKAGLKNGYLEVPVRGKVHLRDSFLTFALLQVENKRVIMSERPKVGVGIIVLNGERVLVGKRKGSHGAGTWGLPGGHLEFGETEEQCAARELLEETGLKATSIRKGTWTNDLIDESKHYITLFMIVDQFEGTPEIKEPEKCEKWEWMHWDSLPEPLFAPLTSLKKGSFRPVK